MSIKYSDEYYSMIIWDLKDEINSHLHTIDVQDKRIKELENRIKELNKKVYINPDACMPQYY